MIIISRALLLSVSVLLLITVSISSTTSPPNNHNIKDVSLTNNSSNLRRRERIFDSINNDSSSDSDNEDSGDKDITTRGNRKDRVTNHHDKAVFGNDDSDHEQDVKDYLAKKTLDRKLKQSVQKPSKSSSNIKKVFGKLSFVRKKQVSYIDVAGFFPEQDDTAPSSSDDESLDYQPEHFKQDRAELQALKYHLVTQIPTTPLPPNDVILSPHSVALRAAVQGLDKAIARLEYEENRKEYMKLSKDDAAVYMEDVEEWEATPFNNQNDDSSDSDEEDDDDMPPPSTNKKRPRSNKLNKKKKRALRKRPRYRGDDYHFRNFPHSFFD